MSYWQHHKDYKERMKVGTSNAEWTVLFEIQKRGLMDQMENLGTAIVFIAGEAMIVRRENMMRSLLLKVEAFTIPDFPFLHAKMPSYLDGPVHLRPGVRKRDERIDKLLRSTGFDPLRFPYKPKLSQERKMEICDTIERSLKGKMREVKRFE